MTSNDAVIINLINSRFDALGVRIGNVERKTEELHTEIQNTREELHSEIQNTREELHAEIQNTREELHTEIQNTRLELRTEIRIAQNDIGHVQTSVYWGFAIMTIGIAIASGVLTLAPAIKELFKTKHENKITEERIQSLIDAAISRALSERKGA